MANNYKTWKGGTEFVAKLQANRAQLEGFLAGVSTQDRQQMAEGLAGYLAELAGRDPNALPPGLSEMLDAHQSGKRKGGKIGDALRGIKNDFYNLFDKHPNVMLTTGGILGAGGGASLAYHYGLAKGSPGGIITSVGNLIFQSEKLVTLSTGPFKKKLDAEDNSLSAKIAGVLDSDISAEGVVPEGMDANSPEGRLVKESGSAFKDTFHNMVRHREMLISNILVAGETFQTGGFVTNAFLDKKYIAGQSPDMHKAEKRTAKFGLVNACSNTLLMGLTYFNQYIDPAMNQLDKNSPTYKQDKAKVWESAPQEHMFKPARICAKGLAKLPESVKQKIPNFAIGSAFLPLTGVAMEGLKGGKDGGMAPLQFYGALTIMANVLINYTAITNRSKATQILKPEEVQQFTGLIAEAATASPAKPLLADPAARKQELEGLQQVIMAQSFIAPEHEGLVQHILSAALDVPFTAVRDHTRKMPTSQQPTILPGSHLLAREIGKLEASAADITAESITLHYASLPEATEKAINGLNALAQQGSHTAKTLGNIITGQGQNGIETVQLSVQALPVLLAASNAVKNTKTEDVPQTLQEVLKTTLPKAQLLAQKPASEASLAR